MSLALEPAYRLVEEFKVDPYKVLKYLEELYDRIERVEPRVKAFITLRNKEEVLSEVEARIKRGEVDKPLFGIAVAVKDNICTRGLRTTCASRMLENFVPPYSATVVERLEKAGAIVIGKTNMDEFAMGSTTETSAFYPTRNPWDLSRVPGGSSGGSAAAIASAMSTLALGSDTGGSIRNPAAFTATYGLKPTYGLVSRYGLIAYASSLDQIGPMARCVEDLAMLLSVIAGHDPRDSTSLEVPPRDYLRLLRDVWSKEPKMKIGIARNLVDGSEEGVRKCVERALDVLCSYHDCEDIEIPYARQAVAAYYIVAMAEASSNLARYDGVRYGVVVEVEGRSWVEVFKEARTKGFGYEVRKRIALGAYVLSAGYRDAYYVKALKFRRLLKEKIYSLFRKFDAIATPTMPILPPKLGELVSDPIRMYLSDVCTVIANLVGIPAISAPAGFSDGLPAGIQLMAPALEEVRLLYLAKFLQEGLGFRNLIAEV